MIYLCVTRFNNKTWKENETYRKQKEMVGCLYPCPTKIGPNIPSEALIFVFEMNNETNQILGIGYLKNFLRMDKYFKVYSEGNYNRYSYYSPIRISREEFTDEEMKFCEVMETIVFKGYSHIKRGQGIQQIPNNKTKKIKFNEKILKDYCSEMFITRYTN